MSEPEDAALKRLNEAFPDLSYPDWFSESDRELPYVVFESVFKNMILAALRERTSADELFLGRSWLFLEELASMGTRSTDELVQVGVLEGLQMTVEDSERSLLGEARQRMGPRTQQLFDQAWNSAGRWPARSSI